MSAEGVSSTGNSKAPFYTDLTGYCLSVLSMVSVTYTLVVMPEAASVWHWGMPVYLRTFARY